KDEQWLLQTWPGMAGAACLPMQIRPRAQRQTRRGRGEGCEKLRRSQSPARVKRHHAGGHGRVRNAAKAGGLHHARKCFWLGKLANRLDKVLLGFRVAGPRPAEAGNYLE